MKGTTTVNLNSETVTEALETYLNDHFRLTHAVRVTDWKIDEGCGYGMTVMLESAVEPDPLTPEQQKRAAELIAEQCAAGAVEAPADRPFAYPTDVESGR